MQPITHLYDSQWEEGQADATLAELRRKIEMLEALLREKGLGKQAADAIHGAGLSEFMAGRDVFERLYRDLRELSGQNHEILETDREVCLLSLDDSRFPD